MVSNTGGFEERQFSAGSATATSWLSYGVLALVGSGLTLWKASDFPGLIEVFAVLTPVATILLLVGLRESRQYFLSAERVGWRIWSMERSINLRDIEKVGWNRTMLAPTLRLAGSGSSISIPFKVEGYLELYLRLTKLLPGRVFPVEPFPIAIKKQNAWMLCVHPFMVLVVLMIAFIAYGAFASRASMIDYIALLIVLALVLGIVGLLAIKDVVNSHALLADETVFGDSGIREIYEEAGHEEFTPVGDLVDIAMAETHTTVTARRQPAQHYVEQRIRISLRDGRFLEIPSKYLNFRVDKIAHTLSRAYNVPLKLYEIDLEEEALESVKLQELDLSGRSQRRTKVD